MKKLLPKDECFQIVLQQLPMCIGQNVLFETLKKFYIYNMNYLIFKRWKQ